MKLRYEPQFVITGIAYFDSSLLKFALRLSDNSEWISGYSWTFFSLWANGRKSQFKSGMLGAGPRCWTLGTGTVARGGLSAQYWACKTSLMASMDNSKFVGWCNRYMQGTAYYAEYINREKITCVYIYICTHMHVQLSCIPNCMKTSNVSVWYIYMYIYVYISIYL